MPIGLIKLFALIMGILAVLIIIALVVINSIQKKQVSLQEKHVSKTGFLYDAYGFFSKISFSKKYLNTIRRRIELLELSDNWTINTKTMKFAIISVSLCVGMFLLLMLVDHSIYFILITIVSIYVVHNQILRLMIDKIEDKLMVQFEVFLGSIRHYFHEHGMIDEAVYDAIEDCDYEMGLHANKFYDILSSEDVDNEVLSYNDVSPNKFFQSFVSLCYIVQKFGDKVVDDRSVFLNNLNYLKQELNIDVLAKRKLNYLFQSLSLIAFVPVFTLKAIEKWAVNNMAELAVYYKGAYGFVATILIFIIVILSYELVSRMQTLSANERQKSNSYFENKLLKIKPISRFVDVVMEKQYVKSLRVGELLKITGSNMRIDEYYIKRYLWCLCGFLIALGIFINVGLITKHNILYSQDGIKVEDNKLNNVTIEDITDMDREYVLFFKGTSPTYQKVVSAIEKNEDISDKEFIDISAKRILEKIKTYNHQYLKWWQFLIALASGVIFYNMPYLFLEFRKKMLQMTMEDEVRQFHTIILMLMHIDRTSVEDILEWMEMFAVNFKENIRKCLMNFEGGDMDALEQLKMDEPFMPFVRIVENLQAATDKISISQAFNELKIERDYYNEKRKQDNEILVNKKGAMGKIIAFIPMVITLLFYILVPFIHYSLTSYMEYSKQLQGIL